MATPQPALTLEASEALSQIYLDIWALLNSKLGENRWCDILPPESVSETPILDRIRQIGSPAGVAVDYRRAMDVLAGKSTAKIRALADELRDKGLHWSSVAVSQYS